MVEDWSCDEAVVSQCVKCLHWNRDSTCAAYPGGVPMSILTNRHDHAKPHKGDGGIRFEPKATAEA